MLVEKVDSNWYKAVNTDADDAEGMVKASHLKILKKLPGSDKVQGFEEGPCAVATHDFSGGKVLGRRGGLVDTGVRSWGGGEVWWILE